MAAPPAPPALVTCEDAEDVLPMSRAEFLSLGIPELSTEPLFHPGVCDGEWRWFQMLTAAERTHTSESRDVGDDGVVRTSRTSTTLTETHAVVVHFDGMWTRQTNRYPTSDVLIVDGQDAMPENWDAPVNWATAFDPAFAASQAPDRIIYKPSVDSLTLTLGYNTSLSSGRCASGLQPLILVGIRCAWGERFGCPFQLSATRVPTRVSDGDVVTAPIEAGAFHYFGLSIGGFDTLTLTLRYATTCGPSSPVLPHTSLPLPLPLLRLDRWPPR